MRRWLAVCCYAGCIAALTACGDDDGTGTDAGEIGQDAGPDGSTTDPCAGRALCDEAGTSCDGDTLVTCAEDADGCLVATRNGCGAEGDVCDDTSGTAACVDPCSLIPAEQRCETDGARSCDGDSLEICGANADGCFVLTATDCSEAPGGTCNPNGGTAGDMPVCAMPADPCADVPAADRCDTAGTSCDGDALVACAPNAFGCLVTTRTTCTDRAGGACDASGATAICTATDACAGLELCDTAGTSCDGPELVSCAPDAFGCLVETRADCTDATFGFCDADATPAAQCSTAAVDPCMGTTACGTEPSRVCTDAATLTVCAPNAFGCFVETTTACAPEICDASSGTAACLDPCSLVETCPAALSCDGDDLVTCEANPQGCLVETSRATCVESCGVSGGNPACVDTLCPSAEPILLDCTSGTITGNTEGGPTVFGGSTNACTSTTFAGAERAYRFRNTGPNRAIVEITTTRGAGTGDFDLFVIGAGAETLVCTDESLACLDTSTGTGATETVEFLAAPGETAYVVYDLYTTTLSTTDFTLAVTCTEIVCGDGALGDGELCDDGNTAAGDGCSPSCAPESGYGCGGEPSVCAPLAPNAACVGATAVTATGTLTGQNIAIGGARPQGTGCGTVEGNQALYYAVSIPPTSTVSIAVTPDATTAPDLVLLAQDACDATACTQRDDSDPERMVLSNLTTSAVTRFVTVHAAELGTAGTFDIAFTYASFADNSICAGGEVVSGTRTITGEDVSIGGPRPQGTGCGTTAGNSALYYQVQIPPLQAVAIAVTPDPTADPDLVLLAQNACGDTSCTLRDDSDPERARIANATGSTVTHIVAVHSRLAADVGPFDIAFTYADLADNAGCSTAEPVTGTRTITGEDLSVGGPRPQGDVCGTGGGNTALYYAVTIPPRNAVDVVTTPASGSNITLLTQEACGAVACTSRTDSSPERTRLVNGGDAPITRIVAVHSAVTAGTGTFDIAFNYSTLSDYAVCSGAEPVSGTRTLTGESVALGGPRPVGTGCSTDGGENTLYYSVTVPPLSAVDVTTTVAGGADIVLLTQDACGAGACTSRDASAPETGTLVNGTGSNITRIVAVHGAAITTGGTFDITFTERAIQCGDGRREGPEVCDDGDLDNGDGCSSTCTAETGFLCDTASPSVCRAVAAHAFCSGALAVTANASFTGENAAAAGPRPQGDGCGTNSGNRSLYYAVTVPPATRVTVTTAGTTDRVLLLQDACGAAECTYRTDSSPETAVLRNDTAAPITQIVSVHLYSATSGTWDIAFNYSTYSCGDGRTDGTETCDDGNTVAGDGCSSTCQYESGYACAGEPSACVLGAGNAYCATAEVITTNTTFTGESTAAGGTRPTGSLCGFGAGARALYYSVQIPAGQQVVVQTTPSADVVLFTQDSCSNQCTYSTDASPERVVLSNTGTSTITRIVGVRPYGTPTTLPTFDISFTYSPGFVAISGACVDTASGTALSITGDDAVSSSAALPFAFTFFGAAVTHFTASTNGLLQLTVGSSSGSTSSSNQLLPNTSTPNGLVAAFWDDVAIPGGSSVRTLVSGAAGSRRFVVAWNAAEVESVPGSRMSFQAHLVEGTNQVELHYCSASGTTGSLRGSGATIGLENGAGTAGVVISQDMVGPIAPGAGFRYTPTP
ncbi:DUF4215 domain-containing protein [Sandaracinus amylolyticus]|uniref:DUF4215 domain-containing protein n=1 Tax=Sandaracinus amylolyticus TaxID=927083 RepID=UPI001F489FDA|nr:DUF4215 domain-containing protein [Sandaracinus amylolyticus]